YHDSELSPDFDKTRSIRADSLFFEEDGRIRKVLPTLRGVGISSAYNKIQFDRYSSINGHGVAFVYLDEQDTFKGWALVFTDPDTRVRYNAVGFSDTTPKELLVNINVTPDSKAKLEIRDSKGNVISKSKLKPTQGYQQILFPIRGKLTGVKDLVLEIKGDGVIEVDWIQFVK